MEEAIQLARYHAARNDGQYSLNGYQFNSHEALMLELRNILVRYGIHGWGDIEDLNGIVIFATDRLKAREVVLSLPTRKITNDMYRGDILYSDFQSLAALVSKCGSARNRGAANTLKWVKAANESLAARISHAPW